MRKRPKAKSQADKKTNNAKKANMQKPGTEASQVKNRNPGHTIGTKKKQKGKNRAHKRGKQRKKAIAGYASDAKGKNAKLWANTG